jgi:N-acetylmuramoyl-L-alanine amidase
MMKKEIKAIHEFLADRFAANKYEEWDYAELLLMQVLGSPNDHLTNQFFHNQIKRRIAMITSSKNPSYQYLRKLLILPVAVLLTVLFAFKYKTKENYSSLYKPLEKVVTVIIDAGHGESDPGVIAGDGTKECDLTLQLAQKIKLLNKNERVHIVLTRNSRETVDLRSRSDLANAQHPDLFISLHVSSTGNKAESQETSGFEVYISKKNSSYLAENKIFGGILLNYLTNLYKTNNKIQQRDMGIWVLDNSSCPSALIECGYITNKQDLDFIKNPSNQNKIAESILHSVEQFAGQRESPDFNDRKKQVSDTTKPVVKIVKNKDGKITGTVNGILIRDLVADNHLRLAGFVLQDNSLIAVPENDLKEVIAKYGTLWDEFYSSFKSRQLSIDKRPAEE